MTVLTIVLLCIAVAGLAVAAAVGRHRLRAQRELTAAATRRADECATELTRTSEALAAREVQRAASEAQVTTVSAELDAARDELATTAAERDRADERAATAEAERDEARAVAAAADAARQQAEAAAADAAERRDHDTSAVPTESVDEGSDGAALWVLEQARSERTWRNSVALGPGDESVFAGEASPLITALQVELDAAREDVGVVVDLDAELPARLTASGSLLTLRVAQELLAAVVRHSESATLRIRPDGADVIVTVDALDEDGTPVIPSRLVESASIEALEGGARVRGAAESTRS